MSRSPARLVGVVLSITALWAAACVARSPEATLPDALPTQASGAFPLTRTDALGREVTVSARPVRIVSLAPSVTEILFAIGAAPQMVGRTEFCDYPPEAATLPTIGGFSASSISVEAVLDLEPDLVISGSRRQQEVAEALAGEGLTVFTVAPATLAEIETGILALGDLTGNALAAQTVVADMQARTAAVGGRIETVPAVERVRVFYEVLDEPLTTTTKATFIGELITLSGGINIFADLEEPYPNVSAEQVLELDPQVIVGPSDHAGGLTAETVAARPGWAGLTAVKNGAVYAVDSGLISRAGPRVIAALEMLTELFYPEVF